MCVCVCACASPFVCVHACTCIYEHSWRTCEHFSGVDSYMWTSNEISVSLSFYCSLLILTSTCPFPSTQHSQITSLSSSLSLFVAVSFPSKAQSTAERAIYWNHLTSSLNMFLLMLLLSSVLSSNTNTYTVSVYIDHLAMFIQLLQPVMFHRTVITYFCLVCLQPLQKFFFINSNLFFIFWFRVSDHRNI